MAGRALPPSLPPFLFFFPRREEEVGEESFCHGLKGGRRHASLPPSFMSSLPPSSSSCSSCLSMQKTRLQVRIGLLLPVLLLFPILHLHHLLLIPSFLLTLLPPPPTTRRRRQKTDIFQGRGQFPCFWIPLYFVRECHKQDTHPSHRWRRREGGRTGGEEGGRKLAFAVFGCLVAEAEESHAHGQGEGLGLGEGRREEGGRWWCC